MGKLSAVKVTTKQNFPMTRGYSAVCKVANSHSGGSVKLTSDGTVLKMSNTGPGGGIGVAQPPQGGIMERLFPKGESQDGESFLDKLKDPLGKEKEKKEKERKKKI